MLLTVSLVETIDILVCPEAVLELTSGGTHGKEPRPASGSLLPDWVWVMPGRQPDLVGLVDYLRDGAIQTRRTNRPV